MNQDKADHPAKANPVCSPLSKPWVLRGRPIAPTDGDCIQVQRNSRNFTICRARAFQLALIPLIMNARLCS